MTLCKTNELQLPHGDSGHIDRLSIVQNKNSLYSQHIPFSIMERGHQRLVDVVAGAPDAPLLQ